MGARLSSSSGNLRDVLLEPQQQQSFPQSISRPVVKMEDTQLSQGLVGDGSVDRRGRTAVKAKTGGWRAAPLIFGTELCERMASLGLQRNLVTYFVKKMNLSKPTAANMVSNFVGTLYLTPFLGGFMADAYMGRFWAISVFAMVQVSGMVILTISAALPSLRPPSCSSSSSTCIAAHGLQLAVLYIGLYLIALGNGGIKPNVSSLGADQFDEQDKNEWRHMSSFFNWFYFIISIGSLVSVTVFVYIQDNVGFAWGFGIPAALMAIAVMVFFAGSSLYRYKLPSGSPLTRIAEVIVAAVRKWNVPLPSDRGTLFVGEKDAGGNIPIKELPHTKQFECLDKAAVVTSREGKDASKSRWFLCTVTQVEEVKMILRMLPIWATTAFVWTALTQMETFSVLEGATLDGSIGKNFNFPPASLSVFELVNVLLILPLYDRYFVPIMRRFTGHPQGITTLQRIGTGIVFSILAMVVAGIVELKRIHTATEYGLLDLPDETIPMSIFWLVPQYFLRGSTEIFTQIGQLEFFYNEAPHNMRSLGAALYLSTIGVGHYLSTVLVSVINKATGDGGDEWIINNLNRSKLYYFYWLLAGLSCVNFLAYLVCAKWYRYKPATKTVQDIEAERGM